MKGASLPPTYFDRIYEQSRDPWNFETSEYERDKYALTLSSLPRKKYRSGLEIGCSIGVLTKLLAARCDALLSLDVSERALGVARERCAELQHVSFARIEVPREMPVGQFDLIVLSEVAYYWSFADLEKAAEELAKNHERGGHLVLVHLTEEVPDYPLSGDEVHDYWLQRSEWTRIGGERRVRFRLDVLKRL